MGKLEDLTGRTFGRWTVLKFIESKKGKRYYLCECSCNQRTQKIVQGAHLKSGASKSCGCLRKEVISNNNIIDITNQRFGKLVAISRAPSPEGIKDRHAYWYCNCDCGNANYIVCGKSLRLGLTKSCGCTKSFGEEAITNLLTKANFIFEKEKSFETCVYEDTNFKAKFDFWINNQYIIEYDGKQHFGIGGWNDNSNFEKTIEHDKIKNNWCRENKIPIIRIPFTIKPEDISIEMLQLETSEFIIK